MFSCRGFKGAVAEGLVGVDEEDDEGNTLDAGGLEGGGG